MPDIEQAQENELCFKIGDLYIKATDTIHYQGNTYTGEEFYELATS